MLAQSPISESVPWLIQNTDPTQQLLHLQQGGWLIPESLAQLCEIAADRASVDLNEALALARLCAAAAEQIHLAGLSAQASYLCAQIQSARAELEDALTLIEQARIKYIEAGDQTSALRTQVGHINVLRELGRTHEAIALGHNVLAQNDMSQLHPTLTAKIQNNLGLCYEELGQYAQALLCWATAESTFRRQGLSDEAGSARNNRGLVYLKLGQAEDALNEFRAAAEVFHTVGLTLNYAQTQMNMGSAHFMLGDPGSGLRCLELSRNLLESLGASADSLVVLLDTADAYLALNLHDEALQTYERMAKRLAEVGMQLEHTRASLGASAALIALNQYRQAVALLQDIAIDPTEAATPITCRVLLYRAMALAGTGAQAEAIAAAQATLDMATSAHWAALQAQAHIVLAELLPRGTDQEIAHLEAAQQLAENLAWPALLTRVYQRLGHAYWVDGQNERATQLLLNAINSVEQSRATLIEDPYRISFLQDKAHAFDDLVEMHIQSSLKCATAAEQQAHLREAFAIAERAKSRALLDRMMQTQATQDSSTANTLSLEQVQAQLGRGTLMLYYYVCGNDISALLIGSERADIECIAQVGHLSDVQTLLADLAVQWDRFLADEAFVQRYARQLTLTATRILQKLHQTLFAKIEPLIAKRLASSIDGANADLPLLIVPHGLLHQVPFHALHDGAGYLLDRFTISYAPSATVYFVSEQRRTSNHGSALVMGIAEEGIPQAVNEAQQVAAQLARFEVALFTGEAASAQHFRANSAQASIIHLACHGHFRHDNPMFSSLQLSDNRITAADVARLKFNHALVTLSACESGRGKSVAGDEILGLPRAFLGAGASSVLVGLWLVHDKTAAAFMAGWYQKLQAGQARVQALRDMQRATRERMPHPYYWAPFALIGQR